MHSNNTSRAKPRYERRRQRVTAAAGIELHESPSRDARESGGESERESGSGLAATAIMANNSLSDCQALR